MANKQRLKQLEKTVKPENIGVTRVIRVSNNKDLTDQDWADMKIRGEVISIMVDDQGKFNKPGSSYSNNKSE